MNVGIKVLQERERDNGGGGRVGCKWGEKKKLPYFANL